MDRSLSRDLLAATLAYPRSMAAALFKPARLYDPDSAGDYSPPLLALGLSLVVYFVGEGIVSRVELAQPGGVEFPSLGSVAAIGVWILLVLAVARGTLARIFGMRLDPAILGVEVLLWPMSVGLLAYGLLVVAAVWFPDGTVAVAAAIDSGFRDLPASWTPAMTWTHAVSTASVLPVLVLSGWGLFNATRVAFRATYGRALLASATTMAVVLVVTLVFGSLVGAITRQVYFWTNPA